MTQVVPPADLPLLPPTERLYWTQPQAHHFTARVLGVRGQAVALDRTLFYPEGGGQPCDAGTLTWHADSAQVTDVQSGGGGVIWHTLTGSMPAVGENVSGDLDATRRYRHSQRHTAEHLLAQAFFRVQPSFAVRSVSMRGPECTLDLAGQPGEGHVQAAQALLTGMLRGDLTLDTRIVWPDKLAAYPLRRPPQVSGEVRVVLFREPDGRIWEASACGGTHLPRASQAAPVVILRLERLKGDLTRVTFMAGEEASEQLMQVYAGSVALARSFSTGLNDLPARVQELRGSLERSAAESAALRRRLADALLSAAGRQPLVGGSFALLHLDDDTLLRPLLERATGQAASVTAAVCPSGACGVASSLPDRPAGSLLHAWLSLAGGRGGGRPELAQGQAGDPQAFAAAALEWAAHP